MFQNHDGVRLLGCLLLALMERTSGFVGLRNSIHSTKTAPSFTVAKRNNAGRSYYGTQLEDPETATPVNGFGEEQSADNAQAVTESNKFDEETIDWTKYWYPIMPLNYLDDDEDMETRAFPITVLGESLAIWRSSSATTSDDISNASTQQRTHEYSVVADVCPHRRAALSTGKVRNGTLSCRYHGWEFNNEGSCTNIPMMEDSQACSSKAFAARSYPTAQHEGLLWVYMDPTDEARPSLPAALTNNEGQQSWNLDVFPVSMQSMIENSFDPSHAPFVHEVMDYSKSAGQQFGMFSPQYVVPMKEHETVEEITKYGFTVKHSPYHISPAAPPGSDKVMTTRQYIAPFTNIAKLPFGSIPLHFIPTREGETMVVSGGWSSPPNKSPFVPQKLRVMIEEFVHFWSKTLATGPYRFYNQDVQIMQSQDQRKRTDMDNKSRRNNRQRWNDIYPTTSDFGVQTLQRWMTKYNRNKQRPDVTMPSKEGPLPIPSAWDRHAKYCPKCKRTLKRLSVVMERSNQVSRWSLGGGSLLTVAGAVVSTLLKQPSSLFWAMGWVSLSMSLATKLLAQFCSSTLERVFASPTQMHESQMLDIYSR